MSNPTTITAPPGVPFIEITREFDAPVDAVYRAHAEPELVKQWLGPRGYEMTIDRYDVTSGGGYAYRHVDGDQEYRFRGVFHTARKNELIIQTFEYEGFPDTVSIETLTFESLDGDRTRITGRSAYPTQEARDGMVESGMESGINDGYERLDELLAV
ncbi:polyketide cyclase [Occultella glacieicola]|uniref:Polyketide cyclase n=1 Tax=Occultella glacieicola TaxID=2518684 RepID=A0ABY2E1X7_9MICO|nr:SRPBCC family protein [Occultella glacieicola]TDE92605.1 polyketide cyclase [Occultella glacieicola]